MCNSQPPLFFLEAVAGVAPISRFTSGVQAPSSFVRYALRFFSSVSKKSRFLRYFREFRCVTWCLWTARAPRRTPRARVGAGCRNKRPRLGLRAVAFRSMLQVGTNTQTHKHAHARARTNTHTHATRAHTHARTPHARAHALARVSTHTHTHAHTTHTHAHTRTHAHTHARTPHARGGVARFARTKNVARLRARVTPQPTQDGHLTPSPPHPLPPPYHTPGGFS